MSQQSDKQENVPGVKRRTVMKAAGVATLGLGAMTAATGTAAASYDCAKCVCFGKIEGQPRKGDHYVFEKNGYKVVVKILDVEYEDGEAVKFEWQVSNKYDYLAVCKVGVKGGPETNWRHYVNSDNNGAYHAWARAPDMHKRNKNRDYYAISNFTFCFCLPPR
jgi:hypothetical protein